MIQARMGSKLLAALGAAILAVVLAAPVASAAEPAEGYEQFAGCPTKAEQPTVSSCVRAEITGGHFQMGNKDVPIENPIVLNGGYNKQGGEFGTSPQGGLSKVKQKVPGGLIGLTGLDWLVDFLGVEALQLFAVTELAGEPGAPFADPLTLPIKVHLINPVLGNNCYVGSDSNPIDLNLTTGTTSPPPPNEPISGKKAELGFDAELRILSLNNATYVDNSFAAPGANGCGLNLFGFIPVGIDGIVNAASGLPSAAGTNETVQNIDAESVDVKFVYP